MKIVSIADGGEPGRLLVTFDSGARIWTCESHLRDRAAFLDTIRSAGLPPLDDAQLRDWSNFIAPFLRKAHEHDAIGDRMDRSRVGPWPGELSIR